MYPFLETEKGIATNVPFILSFIPKEVYSCKNITILKDTDKERIYRIERSLSSLKTEISLDDPLIDNDIKRLKQDIETKICSYSLIAFVHRHLQIVQTLCEKELSGKGIKDGNMIPNFSQYEWTNNLIEVPNKIIINNILTPFIVSSDVHITDVLTKEALTDSILLIIKEHINCGNF